MSTGKCGDLGHPTQFIKDINPKHHHVVCANKERKTKHNNAFPKTPAVQGEHYLDEKRATRTSILLLEVLNGVLRVARSWYITRLG